MREPNRYASLKEAHQAALDGAKSPETPEPRRDTPAELAPYVPSLEEQIEGRLAAYEFTRQQKVDAGLISKTEYAHDLRQLENDIAREVQGLPTRTEHKPAVDAPTQSAEQQREARINPEPAPVEKLVDEKAEKLTQGREIGDAAQARIDRLTASPTDELELRNEQEIGHSPSRGRGL